MHTNTPLLIARPAMSPQPGRPLVGSRVGLGALLLTAGSSLALLHAVSLPVPNASFESPAPPPGFPASPVIDDWLKTPQPIWFDPAATGGITWSQLSGVFPNTPVGADDHIANVHLNQAAYLFALPEVGLYQDLDARYQAGFAYTMTVGLMGGGGIPEGNTIGLSLYYRDGAGSLVPVTTSTVAYAPANFPTARTLYDFSASVPTVQPGDAWEGQNIGVLLLSTSGTGVGYWDADHVRLTVVPEPAAHHLLWVGLGALLLARRRRASPRSPAPGKRP